MIKKIVYILIIVFTLSITKVYAEGNVYYINEETKYEVIYEDNANLLNEQEKDLLLSDMKPLTQYGNVGFVTLKENNRSTSDFASEYYHSKFGTGSGTLFVIDMDNRQIYIFSDGSNNKIINKDKAYIITDNAFRYARASEYYECAKEVYSEVLTLLEGGKILEPMRHISNFVISLVLSAFITFFIAFEVTKMKKPKAKEILKNCTTSFDAEVTNTVVTGEHKVYSPRSDSDGFSGGGSSGGGGGGGGGGGSSGSGGGHSF